MLEVFSGIFFDFIAFSSRAIASYWWVAVPPFLLLFFLDLWRIYATNKYKKNIEWAVLEIHIPREVEKTPKAMEQVFVAMHSIQSSVSTWDAWIHGKVENWMVFEMVGTSESIRFYIRAPIQYSDLLESAVYSQYPAAEISLIEKEDDYLNNLPAGLPNDEYDVTGAEFVLAREDAYPIRTYEYFEDIDEERRLDPISLMTEIMSRLKGHEMILMQLVVRPTGNEWTKGAKKVIAKIMSGEKKSKGHPMGFVGEMLEGLVEFITNFIKGFLEPPTWSSGGDKKEEVKEKKVLTPGEKNIIQAIENKMAKLNFKAAFRFLYIDRKEGFSGSNVSSVTGALRLYNTNDMNALKPSVKSTPSAKGFKKKKKIEQKKKKIYSIYKMFDFPRKSSIFSTEELATLYHFPLTSVKSPYLSKQMFRKGGGPPPNLPIIEY